MREAGLVIIGASLAGVRAATAARRAGHDGPIRLVGAEQHLPYDRPPLSKAFLADQHAPTPALVSTESLDELGIDLQLGRRATGLSLDEREVLLDQASTPFDSLIVATGCTPVTLPGSQPLRGVHTLRTLDDARALRARITAGARALIVGGGFIGAEIATALRRHGAKVTIVEADQVPLVRAVGRRMAGVLASLHARNDVELRCGTTVIDLADNASGTRVSLSDGSVIDADLVVVGIGVRPAVDWLADSGLPIEDGLRCDQTLRAAPGVYAAGDVAHWYNPAFETSMRLESWTVAAAQAEAAAHNAIRPGQALPFSSVPYFWSDWYGQRIQMVGIPTSDEVTVLGEAEGDSWLALYRARGRLVGALALNQPGRIMKYRAKIARQTSWRDALDFARAQAN